MTLFIDTHNEKITIALLGEKVFISQKETNHEHSKYVLNMIKTLLEENNYNKSDINEIIVVNGPGSFTGIRIGVVIAKTLSYTLNVKIKTISSLETFGISENAEFDIIALDDTKGSYFMAKDFKNPKYLPKDDFEDYIRESNYTVSKNKNYDFKRIYEYSKSLDYIDPKNVNPIYIKRLNVW